MDQSFSVLHNALLLAINAGDYSLMIKTSGLMFNICSQRSDNKEIESIFAQMPKFRPLIQSSYIRKTLLLSLFIKSAWLDKLSLGKILLKIIDHMGLNEPVWDYSYKLAKGMIFYRSGDLDTAGIVMNQILTHPTGMVNDRWRAIGLALCQSISSHMGDMKTTQRLTDEIAVIAEKYSSDYALAHAIRYTACTNYLNFDFKGAVSGMEESANVFARLQNHSMISVSRITGWLWESEFNSSDDLLQKASAELKIAEEISDSLGYRELCIVSIGMICKAREDYDRAEALASQSIQAIKKQKSAAKCLWYRDATGRPLLP